MSRQTSQLTLLLLEVFSLIANPVSAASVPLPNLIIPQSSSTVATNASSVLNAAVQNSYNDKSIEPTPQLLAQLADIHPTLNTSEPTSLAAVESYRLDIRNTNTFMVVQYIRDITMPFSSATQVIDTLHLHYTDRLALYGDVQLLPVDDPTELASFYPTVPKTAWLLIGSLPYQPYRLTYKVTCDALRSFGRWYKYTEHTGKAVVKIYDRDITGQDDDHAEVGYLFLTPTSLTPDSGAVA